MDHCAISTTLSKNIIVTVPLEILNGTECTLFAANIFLDGNKLRAFFLYLIKLVTIFQIPMVIESSKNY